LALKLIDERERQLRRVAERARLSSDGKSSLPGWRKWLAALMPGRRPGIKAPSTGRSEIYRPVREQPRRAPIETRDAV
jgi:hypothetical protein